MTEIEKQLAYHDKIVAEKIRKEELHKRYMEITAKQREMNRLYELEDWKDRNREKLEEVLSYQKEINEKNIKAELANKRMEYIKHAYVLGVDLSKIREIFKLTDDEEMMLLAY